MTHSASLLHSLPLSFFHALCPFMHHYYQKRRREAGFCFSCLSYLMTAKPVFHPHFKSSSSQPCFCFFFFSTSHFFMAVSFLILLFHFLLLSIFTRSVVRAVVNLLQLLLLTGFAPNWETLKLPSCRQQCLYEHEYISGCVCVCVRMCVFWLRACVFFFCLISLALEWANQLLPSRWTVPVEIADYQSETFSFMHHWLIEQCIFCLSSYSEHSHHQQN